MRLTVFDVGHGSCALLVADNGNVALFDCGHDDEVGFRPSRDLRTRYGVSGIEHLFISHYDQDHVSDLPALRALEHRMPINILHTNRSISPDQIRQLKLATGPLEAGVAAAIELTAEYSTDLTADDNDANLLGGIDVEVYRNDFPTFVDTNNLSLVTFLHHPQVSIVLPGDLEREGWAELLANPSFRASLERVNVFVASHHGRANGYLPEVFRCCAPDIVVISDTAIQFDTQQHSYERHASGILWNGGPSRCRVLTTRSDGNIRISTEENDGYFITTNAT